MILIGLTGLNASGKGTIADMLKENGFRYYSLSDIVREKATELGLDHSRKNLIMCGNLLRQESGPSVLSKKVMEKIVSSQSPKIVIDSIRNIYEIEELRKTKGFFLIGVDAPVEIRFERSITRGRIGFEKTLEDFKLVEKKENSSDPAKQQLFECLKLADTILFNDGTVEKIRIELEQVLKTI